MRLKTNSNGNGKPKVTSSDVLDRALQHVIETYDGSTLRICRNGDLEVECCPWLGEPHRVAIYDRALNGLQVEALFSNEPPGA